MIIPYVHASRIAKSSRRAIRVRLSSNAISEDVRQRRRLLMGLALFLLPLSQGELVAQQAPPFGQGWSHSDSYGAYAPGPGYGQQGYRQPQPYPQQAYQPQPYFSPDQGYQQTGGQPLGAEQLEQLVAPIALYPDVLLAQVLTASTYPDQVRYVDQWCRAHGNAPAEEIAAGADEKNWDPSLKALTAFPQVLAQMARNLPWTSDLGNAYYNQPQDVLGAVQATAAARPGSGESSEHSAGSSGLRPGQHRARAAKSECGAGAIVRSVECIWPVCVALSGIFAFWRARSILRLVAGKLWPRYVDDGIQPHALGMVELGPQLADPVSTLPEQPLLFPQRYRSGLGFAARRPAFVPWLPDRRIHASGETSGHTQRFRTAS